MPEKYKKFSKENKCKFCRDGIREIDYKEVNLLSKLCSPQGKIQSRRRTGNCAAHQRQATRAIKRARFIALLPYTTTGII